MNESRTAAGNRWIHRPVEIAVEQNRPGGVAPIPRDPDAAAPASSCRRADRTAVSWRRSIRLLRPPARWFARAAEPNVPEDLLDVELPQHGSHDLRLARTLLAVTDCGWPFRGVRERPLVQRGVFAVLVPGRRAQYRTRRTSCAVRSSAFKVRRTQHSEPRTAHGRSVRPPRDRVPGAVHCERNAAGAIGQVDPAAALRPSARFLISSGSHSLAAAHSVSNATAPRAERSRSTISFQRACI